MDAARPTEAEPVSREQAMSHTREFVATARNLEAEANYEGAFQALWDAFTLNPTYEVAQLVVQTANRLALSSAKSASRGVKSPEYDTALRLLQRAHDGCASTLSGTGTGLQLLGLTMCNLGFVYSKQNKHELAARALTSAAEFEQQGSGAAASSTLLNLCSVKNALGQHGDAIKHAQDALRQLEGTNSPLVVTAYQVLGASYESHGGKAAVGRAGEAYRKGLELARGILPAEHEQLRTLETTFEQYMARLNRGSYSRTSTTSRHTPTHPEAPAYTPRRGVAQQQRQGLSSKASPSRSPEHASGFLPPVASPLRPSPPSEASSASASLHSRSRGIGVGLADPLKRKASPPGEPSTSNPFAQRMQATRIKRQNQEDREKKYRTLAKKLYDKEKIMRAQREAEEKRRLEEEASAEMYAKLKESLRIVEAEKYMLGALKIQRMWRGHIVRDLLFLWVRSCVKIQSVFRSYMCRRQRRRDAEKRRMDAQYAAAQVKERKACLAIQSWWRMIMCKQFAQVLRTGREVRVMHSIRVIQRVMRRFRYRMEEEQRREQEELHAMHQHLQQTKQRAALRIQTCYRRFVASETVNRMRDRLWRETRAAVIIQRRVRGLLARRWVKANRLHMLQENQTQRLKTQSATTFQRIVRGFLARRRARRMRISYNKREHSNKSTRAAIAIQCAWRCSVARHRARALRQVVARRSNSCALVQCHLNAIHSARVTRARARRFDMYRAAVTIQCFFRFQTRRHRFDEIARYHAAVRNKEAAAERRTEAAMNIQAWVRGNQGRKIADVARTEHNERVRRAVTIQCAWRCHVARKELRLLKHLERRVIRREQEDKYRFIAARRIQCAFRCMLARRKVHTLRTRHHAAEKIQSVYRMHRSVAQLAKLRLDRSQKQRVTAAIRIQRSVRLFLRRLRLYRLRTFYIMRREEKALLRRKVECATVIQAVWKGHRARRWVNDARAKLLAHTSDVLKIQIAYRAYLFRRRFEEATRQRRHDRIIRHKAATRIQAFWRMVVTVEYVAHMKRSCGEQTSAALTIQCAVRRSAARTHVQKVREAKEAAQRRDVGADERWVHGVEELHRFGAAALSRIIVVRGYHDLERQVCNAEKRRAELVIFRAAARIQGLYRGFVERLYVRGVRRERAEELRQKVEHEMLINNSATKIQCAWKCAKARRAAKLLRTERAQKEEERRLAAEMAVNPEDVVSGLFMSLEATTQRKIVVEQRFRHKRNHQAARNIQRMVRGHQSRCTAKRLLVQMRREDAAIAIQIFWRNYRNQKKEERMARRNGAAAKIQSVFRRFMVRKNLRDRIARKNEDRHVRVDEEERRDRAATKIENAWRCVLARRIVGALMDNRYEQRMASRREESIRVVQNEFRRSTTTTSNRSEPSKVGPSPPPQPPQRERIRKSTVVVE